jgi:hypothetical protein
MLTIVAVQTNDGYFISEKNSSYYDILMSRKFDSVVPVETFLKGWCFIAIDHKPLKVTHMEEQPDINYRYILKDDSLKSKKLPLELKKENVGHDDKDVKVEKSLFGMMNGQCIDHFIRKYQTHNQIKK